MQNGTPAGHFEAVWGVIGLRGCNPKPMLAN